MRNKKLKKMIRSIEMENIELNGLINCRNVNIALKQYLKKNLKEVYLQK